MLVFIAILLIAALVVAIVRGRMPRTITVRNRNYDSYDRRGSESPTIQRPNTTRRILGFVASGLFGLGILFFGFSSFYTQDVGTAVVERDITGNIVGQSNESGFHWKAPWVDTVEFNVRNQPVNFLTPQNDSSGAGYAPDGPHITVQDKDGVTSDIDITVRYSIKPSSVSDIYTSYKSEDAFKTAFIFNDIRSVVREVPNKFSTLQLLTDRAAIGKAIEDALVERWKDAGVIVDSVALQETRPPQEVKDSYAAAQQAEINVTTEENKLEATKVSSQNKVVQAEAEAEANRILSESLSNEVLEQRALDTLKEIGAGGNLVVVPNDFSGILNLPQK